MSDLLFGINLALACSCLIPACPANCNTCKTDPAKCDDKQCGEGTGLTSEGLCEGIMLITCLNNILTDKRTLNINTM